jgi:hypothetical protein
MPSTAPGSSPTNAVDKAIELNRRIAAARAAELQRRMADMTQRWMQQIRQLRIYGETTRLEYLRRVGGQAFAEAEAALARQAAQRAAILAAEAEALAAEGTLVAGLGTTIAAVVIPVVGMIAVQVALGAGYAEAREIAKREQGATGFARGFVMGLLEWTWDQAVTRFPAYSAPSPWDPQMKDIKELAYLKGQQKGFLAARALPRLGKKVYLAKLHTYTTTSAAGWNARSLDWMEQMRAQLVQKQYVIDLAGAGRKHKTFDQFQ